MRRIFRPLAAAALVALVAVALPFATTGVAQEATISRFAVPAAPPQAAVLKREEDLALERAEAAVREMQAVAKTEPEKQLANNDSRIVAEIRRLVLQRQAARSSGSTPGAATSSGSSSALMTATQHMQETQMSFNLQYLMLQSEMQNDNRQFTAVSNIMKTKHDTVKNSLSNIR